MIHLGFVFEKTHDMEVAVRTVLDTFHRDIQCLKFSYAMDTDGANWIEQDGQVKDWRPLLSHHYGNALLVLPEYHGLTKLPVRMTIEKEQDCFGFLFGFQEENLSSWSLDQQETIFMEDMRKFSDRSNALYAFCDFDAEIEHSIIEREHINREYAIVYWSKQQVFLKNAWKIDGLTNR
ncbi:Imm64 family immunity protein [Exiguobacterium acetylicum]